MRTGLKRTAVALASALMLVVACANGVESRGQPNTAGPGDIATNLDVPWGIAFLPDGSALIAERDSGAIKQLSAGAVNQVGGVAGVAPRGEGGLLGLATAGQTVFAYLTTAQDNRVVAMRFDGGALTGQSPILAGIPAGSRHDGGRIAFGPDGKLYVATGESGNPRWRRTGRRWAARFFASIPTARSRRIIPIRHRRSGHSVIATFRGWRGIRPADCGPRSTARIGWTSST